mmetsp:Transcript_27670/g.73849  ORF Transcript_27670/g.73849 Transcript_27670/m.73849 type:complete len:279 (+) Transcript_27670:2-838(+)
MNLGIGVVLLPREAVAVDNQFHRAAREQRRLPGLHHLAEGIQKIQRQLRQIHNRVHSGGRTSGGQRREATQHFDALARAQVGDAHLQMVERGVPPHRSRAGRVQVVGVHGAAFLGALQRESAHAGEKVADDVIGRHLVQQPHALLAQPGVPIDLTEVKTQLQLPLDHRHVGVVPPSNDFHVKGTELVRKRAHLGDHRLEARILVQDDSADRLSIRQLLVPQVEVRQMPNRLETPRHVDALRQDLLQRLFRSGLFVSHPHLMGHELSNTAVQQLLRRLR